MTHYLKLLINSIKTFEQRKRACYLFFCNLIKNFNYYLKLSNFFLLPLTKHLSLREYRSITSRNEFMVKNTPDLLAKKKKKSYKL